MKLRRYFWTTRFAATLVVFCRWAREVRADMIAGSDPQITCPMGQIEQATQWLTNVGTETCYATPWGGRCGPRKPAM